MSFAHATLPVAQAHRLQGGARAAVVAAALNVVSIIFGTTQAGPP